MKIFLLFIFKCCVVVRHVVNGCCCCCWWWCHVCDGFVGGFVPPNTVQMGGGLIRLHDEPS